MYVLVCSSPSFESIIRSDNVDLSKPFRSQTLALQSLHISSPVWHLPQGEDDSLELRIFEAWRVSHWVPSALPKASRCLYIFIFLLCQGWIPRFDMIMISCTLVTLVVEGVVSPLLHMQRGWNDILQDHSIQIDSGANILAVTWQLAAMNRI